MERGESGAHAFDIKSRVYEYFCDFSACASRMCGAVKIALAREYLILTHLTA